MNTTNNARFCSCNGSSRADRDCTTPAASPPTTAPATLPRPPSTAAVNISTTNCEPTAG